MSFITDYAKNKMMTGSLNLTTATLSAALIDKDTQIPLVTNKFLSEIDSAAIVAQASLLNPTVTGAVFDADDVIFTSVSGATVEGILIYEDTGDSTSSTLIAYIDAGTGLPITPTGTDVSIIWSSSEDKIFKL